MISVTILTKDSAETLGSVLDSVRQFSEVIILDTGSIDQTLEIAKGYPNVKVFTHSFIGFGPLHNLAAEYATHPWILSLDSDEVLSEKLAEEIRTLSLDQEAVYSIPFHNYFNGKHIKWCGWYPERHVRLYNKKRASFSMDQLHEKVECPSKKIIFLKEPIYHTSYRSLSDFLRKMEIYSTLFAKQYAHQKRSSMGIALLHSSFAFIKSYILKRGFLGGHEGFLISLYQSQTAFYKYLKLAYVNRSTLPPCSRS